MGAEFISPKAIAFHYEGAADAEALLAWCAEEENAVALGWTINTHSLSGDVLTFSVGTAPWIDTYTINPGDWVTPGQVPVTSQDFQRRFVVVTNL